MTAGAHSAHASRTPVGSVQHHRRRPKRIRWIVAMVGVLAVFGCGVTSFFAYQIGTEGPETPRAAVDTLMRSVAKRSINEFESVLCAPKRNQAGAILRSFNDGMVDFNQQLTGVRWKVIKQATPRKGTREVSVDVTFTVVSAENGVEKRESRGFPIRVETVDDNGWYVCGITILTL